MKKALLVIDMQNICMGKEHADFFTYDNESLILNVNKTIENNKKNLVVYIRNMMKDNFINKLAPFHAYEGTKEVELVDSLLVVSDHIYDKYVGNAFTNKELNSFLKDNNIDTVEVVGVDGGGCVAKTALGAIQKGYRVIINNQAIGTKFIKNKEKYDKKLQSMGASFV